MSTLSAFPHRAAANSNDGPPGCSAPALRLFLFQRTQGAQYCLTADRDGCNLPKAGPAGGWTFVRVMEVVPGEVRPAFDTVAAAEAVAEYGYVLIGPPFHVD